MMMTDMYNLNNIDDDRYDYNINDDDCGDDDDDDE